MKLNALLEDVSYKLLKGDDNVNIKYISEDSRKVQKSGVFIALTGDDVDGHDYIDDAIENGACAVIVSKDVDVEEDVVVIKVDDIREVMAKIAIKYFNAPANNFRLIGVTGTNGKTSTVILIEKILNSIGKKTGRIGTIENVINGRAIKTKNTTPDSITLQHLFHEMRNENVSDVVMEVSSHGLVLKRVFGVQYDIAVFTNLTHEHLDFHKTFEEYKKAKKMLFKITNKAVINIDDPYGEYMVEGVELEKVISYSTKDDSATLYAKDIKMSMEGCSFTLVYDGKEYKTKIQTAGLFSIYNALAAIGAVLFANVPIEKAIEVLASDSRVKGRYQVVKSDKGVFAVVDYAHAPDGLLNVLKTTKEVTDAKVITVFGCGGDRDKTKRPIMGEIVGQYSDQAIITSDNPRTEDPFEIIDEVEVGMKKTDCEYEKIEDRKEAIRKGLSLAKSGDVVMITGKGHEDYQIIGDKVIHLDDMEIVKEYFKEENETE